MGHTKTNHESGKERVTISGERVMTGMGKRWEMLRSEQHEIFK